MADTDNIQQSILKAMDTLVGNRINQIATDRTISATVAGCTNALTREYLVSYSGGQLRAYAQEGATYSDGEAVYVLVPEGDFSKTKTIINRVQAGVEDNENISFVSSALSDYNLIGRNCISDPKKITPYGLYSYKKEDYAVLYEHDSSSDNKFLSINIDELENNLKEAEAVMLEADFRTCLPKAHKLSKSGEYGLTFVLAFKDGDKTDNAGNAETKLLSYTIDSPTMTGSPFQFDSYVSQYQIFPINVEDFLYIDSIVFYSRDFVDKTDDYQAQPQPYGWGADIFVRNVEMYGLKKITAVNGDYKLSIGMPDGSTFKSINSNEELKTVAKVTKKNSNITDSTTFYWFKEDGRVTSSSESYQMYGGAGWAYQKDKGLNKTFYSYGSENRAYENKYMVVAVYKESVVLKEQFTFYNDAAKRDLSITSTLGTEFSFDRGTPTFTCLIDGKSKDFEVEKANPHPDTYFRFVWSKIDEYNQTLLFNETYDELKQKYNDNLGKISYAELVKIKNQMALIDGSSWDKNVLIYPVKGVDSKAKFKCSVYLRDREPSSSEQVEDIEYCIGSAEIIIKNASVADPTTYYIQIENGDQVFQYSESGVSPDSDRYTDPLEIKPLTCHFYDPAGLEVNKQTYSLKWRVPLENSLIVVPKEGMTINHANDKIEWCTTEIFPLAIKPNYDYSAMSNQVTAIVTYQGIEYTQDSNLLFTKVGENGTNGTDIVVKVSPVQEPKDGSQFALVINSDGQLEYNTGQTLSQQALKLDLYQRNEKITYDEDVTWSILGGNGKTKSKYLSVLNGVITYSTENAESAMFRNQIIKADIKYNVNDSKMDYYGFYPLPIIKYNTNVFKISIDKNTLLKSITYNADGRNPLYNKNQGVVINAKEGLTYRWTACGGLPTKISNTEYEDLPANAAFKLMKEKDDAANAESALVGENLNQIYILPDDIYDGAYSNNIIHCEIYGNNSSLIPDVEVYIPIYMSLNNYGLKSLNAWDGTHVEINEDDNYIMAPQIGAGEKDENNKFTGLVMGTAQTYDQSESSVGLLGYSHGKQSIWLDAETGKAVFGLPEDQASQNNHYAEGRIELVPGGESHIGSWRIGSRALYNITQTDSYEETEPDKPYTKYPVKDAQFSIPPEAQGMILGANPAYLSVKSMPLTEDNSEIDWDGANTTIKQGDSLEVEIDPKKSSTFSIYRHTKDTDGSWTRYPLVGINQSGQFYTNAVEDGESSMGIGKVGAFGTQAADGKYVGAQFGWKGTNLFKFFTDITVDDSDEKKPLFITAGSTVHDEYPRAIGLYGSQLNLYADDKSTDDFSTHRVIISPDNFIAGHEKSYLSIPSNKTEEAKLILDNDFSFSNPEDNQTSIETGQLSIISNKSKSSGNAEIGIDISSNQSIKATTADSLTLIAQDTYSLDTKGYAASSIDKEYKVTSKEKDTYTYLTLDSETGHASTLSGNGLSLIGDTAGITLDSKNSADGIKLQASIQNKTSLDGGGVTFMMVPQSGGNGTFSINAGTGSIKSQYADLSFNGATQRRSYVGITPGLTTPWITATGTYDGVAGGTISISADRDIRSVNGWMYGGEFRYNSAKAWNCMGSSRSSDKVSDHLGCIYDLLNNLQTQIKNEITNRTNADNNLSNRVTTAQNTANNAQNTANQKLDTSTFNNHKHQVHYAKSKVSIDGKQSSGEYVSVIGTGFSNVSDTSTPS